MTMIISKYSLFLSDFEIKREVFSLISESESVYYHKKQTEHISLIDNYKYITEISKISLISI